MIRRISQIRRLIAAFFLVCCWGVVADIPPTHSLEGIKIGGQALELIRKFEGFSSTSYPDMITGGAPWAYGYGFTTKADGKPVGPGDRISRKQADTRLVREAEKYCGGALKGIPAEYLTQNRIDAAASLCWNIGVPNLLRSVFFKRWAKGDVDGAAKAMTHWVARGTNAERVLRARRQVEIALFRAKDPILMGNLE
jgi:lysozyme